MEGLSVGQSHKNKKIAIVDDVSEMHALYSLTLKRFGHEVVYTASSGEEIVNEVLSGNSQINTIIMDYRMSGINGLEAAKRILKERPEMGIIMASADDAIKGEALKAGVARFLVKPFPITKIAESVNST